MRGQKSKHYIDGLAGILTFVIFAACVLSALLSGAGVYKRLTERDGSAYESRSCVQYVAMKLRQARCAECVSLEELDGIEALCITETIGEREYVTYIYCSDGWLRELFAAADEGFMPAAGEKLLETASMDGQINGSLVTVSFLGDSGETASVSVTLRGGEGAA